MYLLEVFCLCSISQLWLLAGSEVWWGCEGLGGHGLHLRNNQREISAAVHCHGKNKCKQQQGEM